MLCGCRLQGRLLERLYLPTDCMMSRSIGAAKSGLRWMNMERTTTARLSVSSSYSSSTAAQSRHLEHHTKWLYTASIIKNTCFKTGRCWLIDSPVRHCSRLLINKLLGCRNKHADCAWRREKASFCRNYKGSILYSKYRDDRFFIFHCTGFKDKVKIRKQ